MPGTSASNTRPIDLDTTDEHWVERTCDDCGETYMELAVLADVGPNRCHDCRPGYGGLDLNLGRMTSIGVADSRPFMEFGPLSHGRQV